MTLEAQLLSRHDAVLVASRLPRPSEPRVQTLAESVLLLAVAEARQPMGARAATKALADTGIDMSESTVTRLLRRLDARGLTRPVGAKGRLPTEDGRRLAASMRADQRLSAGFAAALDIRSVEDLVDLLLARRAVERETVRTAASRATPTDVAMLRDLLESHHVETASGKIGRRGAHEFHRGIGRIAGNKVLGVLMEALLSQQHDALEQILDVVTKSGGTLEQSQREHEEVLGAIEARDADAAEAAMLGHLDRLLAEAREFSRRGRAGMMEQILALVQRDVP